LVAGEFAPFETPTGPRHQVNAPPRKPTSTFTRGHDPEGIASPLKEEIPSLFIKSEPAFGRSDSQFAGALEVIPYESSKVADQVRPHGLFGVAAISESKAKRAGLTLPNSLANPPFCPVKERALEIYSTLVLTF
jgi:hypothetical protein